MLKKVLFNNLMLAVTFQLTSKADITVSNDSQQKVNTTWWTRLKILQFDIQTRASVVCAVFVRMCLSVCTFCSAVHHCGGVFGDSRGSECKCGGERGRKVDGSQVVTVLIVAMYDV